MSEQLRKKIQEALKEIFDQPEVLPAQPKTKPGTAPEKPQPRRILRPSIHPGSKPAPKAKKKNKINGLKEFKLFCEKLKNQSLIKEAPMDFDNPNARPHPNIVNSIEQGTNHPFSNIDIFNKNNNGQKTIEKLGSEEFRDVQQKIAQHGNASMMELYPMVLKIKQIENRNIRYFENLAKTTVQRYFGIPQEVMDNIFVELKNPGEIEPMDDEDDNDMDAEELMDDFTDEEKLIIQQNVPKRIISNSLMMGAGFRAHNLLDKIKAELDRVNPSLYSLYSKLMSNTANLMWQIPPDEEMQANGERPNGGPQATLGGKSELILGEDENEDGIREVEGAKAQAIVFPVLLHETVKAVIEYIFANGLPQYTENVNREIMKQSEKFHFEHWQKLLGPRLWKYLHDAIDYIVHDRGSDYTIVAYLLQEISMLEPRKFIALMDFVLHDGDRAIRIMTNMVDGIEADLESQEAQGIAPAEPEGPDFSNVDDLMGQINNLLNKPKQNALKDAILNHEPFNSMEIDELKEYIKRAIDIGEFEKAAEARDELNSR